MPQVIIAVGAAAAGAAAAGALGALAGTAIIGSLTYGVVVQGLVGGAISILGGQLFNKKPDSASFTSQIEGRSVIIRSAIETRKIVYGRVRTSGPLTFVETSDTGPVKNFSGSFSTSTKVNQFLHMVVPLAAHEIQEIEEVWLGDDILTLDSDGYATNTAYRRSDGTMLVRVKKHLGSPDQLVDSFLVSEAPSWTSAHRGRGVPYIYLRLQYDTDKFPNGIPQVRCVIKGAKVYDPRTALTAYSDNWALCMRDYTTNSLYGFKATDTEIDDDILIGSANVCDEEVLLKDGVTTVKRYTVNGVLDTGAKRIDNLENIKASALGVMIYSAGTYKIYPSVYVEPDFEITESMLRGDMIIQAAPEKGELFNGVRGVYISEEKDWKATDFAPVSYPFYVQQDYNEEIWRDVEMPFILNTETAQRLAALSLNRARQGINVVMPLNYKPINLDAWDTISLTHPDPDWDGKVFRVLNWAVASDGGVDLTLKEEAAEVYDWDETTAVTYDPAPNTNLPSSSTVLPPGAPQVEEHLYDTTLGSGLKTLADLTWAASLDAFVTQYEAEYKLTDAIDWETAGATSGLNITIFDIEPGVYTFRTRAVNSNGVRSDWSPTTTKEIFGLKDPPSNVTNFAVVYLNETTFLKWDTHPDLDVKVGGTFEIRYSPETSGASWASALLHWQDIPGSSNVFPIEILESGTWFIKAIDSTSNQSIEAAQVINTATTMLKYNALAVMQEDPTFPGVKDGLVVNLGILSLDGAGMFDDAVGDFDDAPGLFDAGAGALFEIEGSYTFENPVDAGKVVDAKVTAHIKGIVYDATDSFDERQGLFDDQEGLFDGDDTGRISTTFFLNTTDDDPNDIDAVWTRQEFKCGNFRARGFLPEVEFLSENAALNIDISELRVNIDLPDVTDILTVNTSASGYVAVVFNRTFQSVPGFGAAIASAQDGDRFVWQNETADGVEVGVKNAAGSFVARTILLIVRGY